VVDQGGKTFGDDPMVLDDEDANRVSALLLTVAVLVLKL
jgi:hypothetical protein